MPYSGLIWLVDVLRAANVKVVEYPNWQNRGRGPTAATIRGVIAHHTASRAGSGPTPALQTCVNGRSDLPGPLCHLVLGRDGVYHVIAAGRANHAGKGYWQGVTDGNGAMIGIEAENNGLGEPWPAVQMDAYRRGCAALLLKLGAPVIMLAGHKEYALPKGRKSDPSFDMVRFREECAAIMKNAGGKPEPRPPADGEGPDGLPLGLPRMRVVGVEPDTLTFRKTPAGEDAGELPEGTVLAKIGASGTWTNVETRLGFRGWVASRFLEAVTP